MNVNWVRQPAASIDHDAADRARARQAQLTKPEGALGRLEVIAARLAGMQGTEGPRVDRVHVAVFAADHGVAVEAVSAYPRSVTRQMVANFAAGGAAVNVLARELGAQLEIVDVGTLEGSAAAGVLESRCGTGTANLACAPAMRAEQLEAALDAGRAAAERARAADAELFVGGEMGIGNTTSAAALGAALLRLAPAPLVGPGSGLDGAGVRRKLAVVTRALALHGHALHDPMQALRRLGGFEIAALAGAFVACARAGIPLLIDGFIASVAALVAARVCRGAGDWMLFAHRSSEPGHAHVLEALGVTPLLDLGMRLGEGSGALLALPILRLACALHTGMATFEEAGVAGRRA